MFTNRKFFIQSLFDSIFTICNIESANEASRQMNKLPDLTHEISTKILNSVWVMGERNVEVWVNGKNINNQDLLSVTVLASNELNVIIRKYGSMDKHLIFKLKFHPEHEKDLIKKTWFYTASTRVLKVNEIHETL